MTTTRSISMERAAGLLLVVGLHILALWGLWQHRLLPAPADVTTLFVNFIAPPAPGKKETPKRPQQPKPIEKPRPQQIVAATPVVAPSDYVAPTPLPESAPAPVIETPPMPLPVGPVTLSAELAVVCPERSAPDYPAVSRRFGEEGTVILRVELDETGRVATAQIDQSSGYVRLDQVALAVVKTWRCTPALRNGQPIRATARQPFKFILQGT